MKPWVVEFLRCPKCLATLRLHPFESDQQEIVWGVLRCENPGCTAWYPIATGVPRMLEAYLRENVTAYFARRFPAELAACDVFRSETTGEGPEAIRDDLKDLKVHTMRNFGFEWNEYARFGWDDGRFNIDREEDVFFHKSLVPCSALAGKLVLDAGCGNGRYSFWAAKYGAKVVGVDIGDGVDAAYANTRSEENVQIVQADIFKLPFCHDTFDLIFSIGVLMHTGNARRATEGLARILTPGGSLSVHLYGKGNLVYEYVDRALRRRTTRFSIAELQAFTDRVWRAVRLLERVRLLPLIGCFMRLDPHPHCIFDWYSAPIATHHTYREVKEWFRALGMSLVQTNERKGLASRIRYRIVPDTVTVRAQRIA